MNKYVLYLDGPIDYTLENNKYKEKYRGKIVVPSGGNFVPAYFFKGGREYYYLNDEFVTEFVEPLVKELENAKTTSSDAGLKSSWESIWLTL